ncbi:response regulator [Magnetovibrio sp. PR-2]|uniref:response regulator n=1 Tax=Magnetovibrio sp. PR-2 TaxID=3120356 RepID=UPI002FCE0D12
MAEGELSKILYVEDDPDIQVVAQMALETVGGFTLCVCSSGQDALDQASDFAPDLILLDVMMPEMDGPTTLVNLRDIAALAETPAVFMTAKVMPSDVERYRELGAVDVIAKPFDPMTLAGRIQEIWSTCDG